MSSGLRLSGLATGMDTETMIKQLMKPYNMRVDKMKQDKQVMQWKQEMTRDMIKELRELKNSYLNIDSPDATNMVKSGSFSVASITSSKEEVLTATAMPGAVNIPSQVSVKQVAKPAEIKIDLKDNASLSTKMSELGLVGQEITLKSGTDTFLIKVEDDTLEGFINKFNSVKANGSGTTLYEKFKISFSELTADLKFETRSTGENQKVELTRLQSSQGKVSEPAIIKIELNPLREDGSIALSTATKMSQLGLVGQDITLKYGNDTFSIKVEDETIESFITNFNAVKSNGTGGALSGRLTVGFEKLTGELRFSTNDAGENQKIELTRTQPSQGKDALLEITPAGETRAVEVKKGTNDFTIDNIQYNLNANAIIADSTKPVSVTLTSKADAQKSVDKVKGFIDKYNATVDKMYDKYRQKKQYKFAPLTEEQKKDMKEEEIKKWEIKAKEGLVSGDEAIGSMLNAMRAAIFTPVLGSGISLKDIGLDSYSGMESSIKPGQIKIVDANKLKAALETRGDQVMNLFSGVPDSTKTPKEKIYESTGIFKRLNDILNNYVGKSDAILLKKAGIEGSLSSFKNDLTEKMQKKDAVISQLERKMSAQEERYYQKFAQLEKAMNMLNSQSSWLTAQLGGGK